MIYFDNNATSAVDSRVAEYIAGLVATPFNPSSIHQLGRQATYILTQARIAIKNLLGLEDNSPDYKLVFTASGTEANNLLMRNFQHAKVITCATEHVSILSSLERIKNSTIIGVDKNGLIHLTELEQALAQSQNDKKKTLISVMLANNETGVIQPLAEIVRLAHNYGALVHSDLVQAVGKINIDLLDLQLDFATLSGHKFGATQGCGALLFRSNQQIEPLIVGGKQEFGIRSGTENVAAISALGKACEIVASELGDRMEHTQLLQNKLEEGLLYSCPSIVIFANEVKRLPNTSLFSIPNSSANVQLVSLDLENIAVSSGAACSSGKVSKSHVLEAMGISEHIAQGAIRVSTSYRNSLAEIVHFLDIFKKINKKYIN